MKANLENFLTTAIQSAFQDLDVFCNASIKIIRKDLLIRNPLLLDEAHDRSAVAMMLSVDQFQGMMLLLPTSAAIFLSASMMMMPLERIQEMMHLGEIDDEAALTIHEVGNILAGSISRVARDTGSFPGDVRISRVYYIGTETNDIPLVEQLVVSYQFSLKVSKVEPFGCTLHFDAAFLKEHFSQDRFWITSNHLQKSQEKVPASSQASHSERSLSIDATTSALPAANLEVIRDFLSGSREHSDDFSLANVRILLADSSWVVRRTLASTLRQQGCILFEARDFNSAREIIWDQKIDVVLLDWSLVGGGGSRSVRCCAPKA